MYVGDPILKLRIFFCGAKYDDYEPSILRSGKDEVLKIYREEIYMVDEDDACDEEVEAYRALEQKILDIEFNGYEIYEVSIPNSDFTSHKILELSKNVVIIHGGY